MATSPRSTSGSTARSGGARRDEARLSSLLSQVSLARAEFRAGRGDHSRQGGHVEQARRTARLAEAMEAYADEAATAGVPLPYRYRDEMRLYRSMAADQRGNG
jgi:hypothetical protein